MLQDRGIAKESKKTKKIREKLRKKFEEMDQKITPQALKRKSSEIQRWIALHASKRIILRKKSVSIFNRTQNTADLGCKKKRSIS